MRKNTITRCSLQIIDKKRPHLRSFLLISEEEMKAEIIKALGDNQKLLKTIYYFYKSLEY